MFHHKLQALLDLLPGNGWKTYLGGIGLIALAIGNLLLNDTTMADAWQTLFAGVAIIGAAHKGDKIIRSLNGTPNDRS